MISERKLAEKLTSFWQEALPRGPAVSRYVNLQRVRFAPPLSSEGDARRRALINEIGFRLFLCAIEDGRLRPEALEALPVRRRSEIGREVARELEAALPLPAEGETADPDPGELEEAGLLAGRLVHFFRQEAEEPLVAAPELAGCGILESCRADVLAGKTLWEVKAGESSFRLVDLRQVLIYCALNHALPRYDIRGVGLVNPRLGLFFETDLESLVRGAAGVPADSLFFEMIHYLSDQGVSL